jgi:hypothetical protein
MAKTFTAKAYKSYDDEAAKKDGVDVASGAMTAITENGKEGVQFDLAQVARDLRILVVTVTDGAESLDERFPIGRWQVHRAASVKFFPRA